MKVCDKRSKLYYHLKSRLYRQGCMKNYIILKVYFRFSLSTMIQQDSKPIQKRMKSVRDWIIISPEGITYGPNHNRYENFQVLGFVAADTEQAALQKLEEEYSYLQNSGFSEIWIYPLENKSPYITYLSIEPSKVEYEDDIEKEIIEQITRILNVYGILDM